MITKLVYRRDNSLFCDFHEDFSLLYINLSIQVKISAILEVPIWMWDRTQFILSGFRCIPQQRQENATLLP
jgi:hypothetical protein